MQTHKGFTVQDLATLKHLSETMGKMDALLDNVKEYVKLVFRVFDDVRATKIRYYWYGTEHLISVNLTMALGIAWHTENPYLYLRAGVPKEYPDAEKLFKILAEVLTEKGWAEKDTTEEFQLIKQKPISLFMLEEEQQNIEQFGAMQKFFKIAIDELEEVRDDNFDLF
ncbi:MAG: hypothetical protein NZ551_05230 [Microscillaceae bacterium]|nr:hypothetical protein [Microscillaceae bacterium]MDW8460597.1 hypothetical protein [Cytophagales bacterium]